MEDREDRIVTREECQYWRDVRIGRRKLSPAMLHGVAIPVRIGKTRNSPRRWVWFDIDYIFSQFRVFSSLFLTLDDFIAFVQQHRERLEPIFAPRRRGARPVTRARALASVEMLREYCRRHNIDPLTLFSESFSMDQDDEEEEEES